MNINEHCLLTARYYKTKSPVLLFSSQFAAWVGWVWVGLGQCQMEPSDLQERLLWSPIGTNWHKIIIIYKILDIIIYIHCYMIYVIYVYIHTCTYIYIQQSSQDFEHYLFDVLEEFTVRNQFQYQVQVLFFASNLGRPDGAESLKS